MLIALRINTQVCHINNYFYNVSFKSVNIQSLNYNMIHLLIHMHMHVSSSIS